jgi:4'-phosphopantetheinyl transferase
VDCEYASQDIDIKPLMPLVFSKRELDAARHKSSEDQRDTFYRVWVAKEAYLKATGLGLSLDLTKVHIEWDNLHLGGMIEVTGKPEERRRWRLRMLPAPLGHYAAIVVETGGVHG